MKAWVPVRLKARARAVLGIDPWPDLAIRHALFRTADYRALRARARPFDTPKPTKPVLERGHQTSYLVARWLAAAGVTSVFHVGYGNGRYLFYFSAMGISGGGTDLPPDETAWTRVPRAALDEATRRRLLDVDFFALTTGQIRAVWDAGDIPIGVLFSEATFETILGWRPLATVDKYRSMTEEARRALLLERFPAKLRELRACFRNMLFIEPEPAASDAGLTFAACARQLPEFAHSVWAFRPPFDSLFRLTPRSPTRQMVYAFVNDRTLLEPLRAYADPV